MKSLDAREVPAEAFGALSDYVGKRILVTGGRGYIGAKLSTVLASVDCELTLVDRSITDSWMPTGVANISLVHGDISQAETWNRILPDKEIVFHLAQQEYSDCEPLIDWEINALPTIHLCEVCRNKGLRPKVIFTSSANLYGRTEDTEINELTRDDPLVPWAIHKRVSESYLRCYGEKYGVPSTVLRIANVYGPSPKADVVFRSTVNAVIREAILGGDLIVYPNAHCFRDYIYIDDVVRAILLAGAKIPGEICGEIFNIGSAHGIRIIDAWEMIREAVAIKKVFPALRQQDIDVEPFAFRNFYIDTKKFKDASGWRPQVDLRTGLAISVEFIYALLFGKRTC
jgi:UDP-glucose 4-epimerase